MTAGRLVLLQFSHRVAPGLLSSDAWDTLRSAAAVVALDATDPWLPHLEHARVPVEVLGGEQGPVAAARRLVDLTGSGTVVLLGRDDAVTGELASTVLPPLVESGRAPEIEVLAGSWDVPGARLLDLVAVMDRLRSPGGCPWDREQTHVSLLPYLLEETYETVEAIETGDLDGLREELGDLLLQVVFHARLGEEHGETPWSVDDVAGGVVDKLVARHPHVFADASAETAADVEADWEARKHEQKGRSSAVDGVPLAQPALALAAKLLSRVERHRVEVAVDGFPLPDDLDAQGLGELLLGVVAAARSRGLDPEAALRNEARRYAARVRAAEIGGRPGDRSAEVRGGTDG